ncbi:hypothetical protein DHEL01_v210731 [Diaporthe helianthi]|uniref:J domain-containing protein n=1 Tax=Diaporthe helianthi TaxID=158607 RepID=A0A2P5HKU1_DIAHE|nr:hypothetical protein DHEL01_v210731 [Diaporthe helianthi]
MEEAKTRNLYADLGLEDCWASMGEVDLAYMELMSKLSPKVNPAATPADAAELSKIQSAYEILRDPEKRAEYSCNRIDLFKHKSKSAIWRKHKSGWRSPLDQVLRVARLQLESKAWQKERTRRLPANTQLRAKAQLRAHAYHLDLFHMLSKSHGSAIALREVGLGPVGEVPQYWAVFDPTFEHGGTTGEKHQRSRREARKRATAVLLSRQTAIREEGAARKMAADEKDRAEEIKWIDQEAKDSIMMLARMPQYPVSELARHDLELYEQRVRQKVERAEDLLDYLWDKMHSGTWTYPGIKEGLDLGLILRSVLRPKSLKSWHFSTSTQDLAAILLRKLPDEICDKADDRLRLLSNSEVDEVDEKPSFDYTSSNEGKGAEKEVPHADSQPQPRTTQPKQSPFSKKDQPKPAAAMFYKWQYESGAQASVAGSKRARSPSAEGKTQPSKRQKRDGCA